MPFLDPILRILGGIFTSIGSYLTQRGLPKNVEARVIDDEREKKDEFRKALDEQDLKETQRRLADRG